VDRKPVAREHEGWHAERAVFVSRDEQRNLERG
jgi:hypothetical protein